MDDIENTQISENVENIDNIESVQGTAGTEKADYEPTILGFLCNWCSYAGADLAGVSRVQYPPNVKVIRVMCSGRIDPTLIFEALRSGLDGVLIAGCHIGDCHYQTGNYQTKRRFFALMEALQLSDIDPGRVRLEWVSASEGARFGEVITSFTNQIKALGPNPVKAGGPEGEIIKSQLEALKQIFQTHGARTLIGKEGELTEKGNVYEEIIELEEYETIIKETMYIQYIRNFILVRSKTKPVKIKDIAADLKIDPKIVTAEMSALMKRNLLALDSLDGTTPMFQSLVQEVDE